MVVLYGLKIGVYEQVRNWLVLRQCFDLWISVGLLLVSVVLMVLVLWFVFDYSVFGCRVILLVWVRKLLLFIECRIRFDVLVRIIMFCVLMIWLQSVFMMGSVCVNSDWLCLILVFSLLCSIGQKLGDLQGCRLYDLDCLCDCVISLG